MARDDLVLRIKAAAITVELEQLRSQRLGLRPINTFRRHRGWVIPLCGFTAGAIAGSASGRASVSALLSTGFAAIRLQPYVVRFLKII
ncbi:hypothetical protein [Pseudohongiella sp.]|uniref:Uncharacterized protein n=1 Tax=marine sediment metagenome TaxID=412755 RepID=A0A0F9W8K0_9ZZZZ|nr:hypothetical protein [Pseudohongiella sp.]HDZ08185.1 hypothetical protein [Pseudohongiella sp.]HEA63153.1 hypothetical protein [Pseudohongiella sp.]